jgi:hypothetical protein
MVICQVSCGRVMMGVRQHKVHKLISIVSVLIW